MKETAHWTPNRASIERALVSVLLLAAFVLAIAFFAEPVSAIYTVTCSFEQSCANTPVFYAQNETGGFINAHVQLPSNGTYNYALCCTATPTLDNQCIGAQEVIRLSSPTNAHAQAANSTTTVYSDSACLQVTSGSVITKYATVCPTGYTAVASLSNDTNAHVGNETTYGLLVCVAAFDIPTIFYNETTPANNTFSNQSNFIINLSAIEPPETSLFINLNHTLIGWYRFEDNESSQNATDSSGRNNNGSVSSATFTTIGKRGRAMDFDGSDDYIRIENSQGLNFSGNFTLEAWVRTNSDTRQTILSSIPTFAAGNKGVRMLIDSDGSNRLEARNDSSAYTNSLGVANLNDGAWHHVAYVVNTASGTVTAYKNGATSGSFVTGLLGGFNDASQWYIGSVDSSTNVFNGTMDEVRIWSRALSAAEIQAAYDAQTYQLEKNFTSLADGNYSYYATVVDAAGNDNSTGNYTIVIDATAPVIDAILAFGNRTGFIWANENSSSGITIYFNNEQDVETTIEVAYTDQYRQRLEGTSAFSDTPSNDSGADPSRIAYSVENGQTSTTSVIYINDTSANRAEAQVTWTQDITAPSSSDSSATRFWEVWSNTTNVTINLSASDAASGLNRTYYCAYELGPAGCIPDTITYATQEGLFPIQLNCSRDGTCQQAIRYYSFDNVSNNESVQESYPVYIKTGSAEISDSIFNGTTAYGPAIVESSNLTTSTVSGFCTIRDSVLTRSSATANDTYPTNCSITDSFVIDTNVTSAIIQKQSYVDPSVIIDSTITNSTILNASVRYSRVENTTFCAGFDVYSATVLNGTLHSGRIAYNGSVYFGPFAVSNICAGVAPSSVGQLEASPAVVNNSAALTFEYLGAGIGYTVSISDLHALDNSTTTILQLNDDGLEPDETANDAVYTANFTLSTLNNLSDGNKTVTANVSDGLGNTWSVIANVTLDNTAPNATLTINENVSQTVLRTVTLYSAFNDSLQVQDCRFANEDLVFVSWESCAEQRAWTLTEGDGTKTVYLQVKDTAGNIRETQDSITLISSGPTTIIEPLAGSTQSGAVQVVVVAPSDALYVEFEVINASNASMRYNLGGTQNAITNDTNPSDGFVREWTTSSFNDGLFNLTVRSYDTNGQQLGNFTAGNIQVDNTAPSVTLNSPLSSAAYNKIVLLNATAGSAQRVTFEYRESASDAWKLIATDDTAPFLADWDTRLLTDGTAYQVRANATDSAGLSATDSATSITLDNTGPFITITNPTAGTEVGGTINVSFTIIGGSHAEQVQFDGDGWQNTDTQVTHEWDTTTYADGAHLIRIRANDTLNNTGYSDILIVQVDNGAESVILITPSSNTYQEGSVTLTVSAPAETRNVTFNISNSSGYFNTTAAANAVTWDNESSDGWEVTWNTGLFGENSIYSIRATAYDISNTPLGNDTAVSLHVDNLVPNTPSNLTVADYPGDTDGILALSWIANASQDRSHYNVYRAQTNDFNATSGTFIKSVSVNGTSDAVPEGTWYYKVTQVDNAGKESNASNQANTTVKIVGPTGTFAVDASYVRNTGNATFTFTTSQSGLEATINATQLSGLDATVLDDFESPWSAGENATLNHTLTSNTQHGSNALLINAWAGNASGYNVTRQISPVNLTGRSHVLLWLYANTTGELFDIGFGEDSYNNFTYRISADAANEWLAIELNITNLSTEDIDEIQYLMVNVTAGPFNATLDYLRASNELVLRDNGIVPDETAADGIKTVRHVISANNDNADGAKTVRALVADDAGDTIAPQVTLSLDNTAPAATISINDDDLFTITQTVTLSLTFSDATAGVSGCRFGNTLPLSGAFEACAEQKAWSLTSAGGTKVVHFEVRDTAGNTNLTNDTIILDTSVPEMIITAPSPGQAVNGTINVTFSGQESGFPQISVDGSNYSNTTNTTYHTLDTTTLADGTHTIRVRDTDAAGNTGYSESLLVEVSNDQPIGTITSPLPGATVGGFVLIAVAAPLDTQRIDFYLQQGSTLTIIGNDTSAAGNWQLSWNSSAQCPTNCTNATIIATVADAAGNTGNASVAGLLIDNEVPQAPVLSGLPGIDSDGIISLHWTQSASNDIAYYNLYRGANQSFTLAPGTLVKNVTDNLTVDTASAGLWYYKVTAVDEAGKESLASNEVNTTVATTVIITDLFGTLAVNDSIVTNGSSILFTFEGSTTDLTVTINASQMQKLDNTSGSIVLEDAGGSGDAVSRDATYSAIFTVNAESNASEGLKQLYARIIDTADNEFQTFVNVTLDKTAPNASLTVVPTTAVDTNQSPQYTASRQVALLISANDTYGIEQCRFANENLAFGSWQSCASPAQWVLSESEGLKTVVMDVKDNAGIVTRINDTITFNQSGAGLDATPPARPVVTDSGLYTNTLHRLDASWNSSHAQETLFGIPLRYEYRITYDGGTLINWTDAGTANFVEAIGLNLTNGTNYTFEVRAITAGNVTSATGYADGIIVDATAPTTPTVQSTHSSTVWSADNRVRFNFSSNDTISGVAGYSYLLGLTPGTAPDSVIEEENEHSTVRQADTDGNATVLKYNSTGNATLAAVEVRQNASIGDVLRIVVQLAESHAETSQNLSFSVYALADAPTTFDSAASNISTRANLSADIAYAADINDAQSYAADIALSQNVTQGRFFVAVSGIADDDNNTYNLLLASANATPVSQTYTCTATCANLSNSTELAITVQQRDLKLDGIGDINYTGVPDGRLYFNVRAVDNAGNAGPVRTQLVLVDTSGPSTPQMVAPSASTNSTSVSFSWTAASDPESGVSNYFLQVANDTSFATIAYGAFVGNVTNATATVPSSGTYYARVLAQNGAGVNGSFSSLVSTIVDTQAPQILFLKPSSSGVVVSTDVTVVVRTDETAICDITGATPSVARANFTFTNSTYHETQITAATGANSWSVRCQDSVNNQQTQVLSFTQSSLSPDTVTLSGAQAYTQEVIGVQALVSAGGTRLGEIEADAFNFLIAASNQTFSVADNGNGNYTITFEAPASNGSYTMELFAGSASDTATLSVYPLSFTVSYTASGLSAQSTQQVVYAISGDFSIGVASQDSSATLSGTSSALDVTADAGASDVFIFMSTSASDPSRVDEVLRTRQFLDVTQPSFGYSIDQDTFVILTDLSYDTIDLLGNSTLQAGTFDLLLDNKGFDETLNKTRIEVRILN